MLLSRDVTDTVGVTFLFRWLHAASLVMNSSRKRVHERRYCDHCNKIVAKSTYYEHRANFYDADSKTWTKQRKISELHNTSSEDSSLSEQATDSCRDDEDDDNDSSCENPILTNESTLPGMLKNVLG